MLTASSDAQLLSVYKGKVANSDIFTGTPIVSDEFVSAGQLVSTVSGAIPAGKEAITVSLDQTHAVGGFVTPGDHVNMLLNFPVIDATGAATDAQGHRVPAPGPQGDGGRFVDDPSPGGLADGEPDQRHGHHDHHPANAAFEPDHPAGDALGRPNRSCRARQSERSGLASTRPTSRPASSRAPTEIVDQINLFDQALPELQRRAQNIIQDPPPPSDLP